MSPFQNRSEYDDSGNNNVSSDDEIDEEAREELENLSSGKNTRSLYQAAADMSRLCSAELTGITGDLGLAGTYTTSNGHEHDRRPSPERDGDEDGISDESARTDLRNQLRKSTDKTGQDQVVTIDGHGEFSDDESAVETLPEDKRLTLRFNNIEVWVPASFHQPGTLDKLKAAAVKKVEARRSSAAGTKPKAAAATKKQVLFGISGKVLPGEVLALMGPSGSGKTTLLSAIGGRVPQFVETSGLITVNNQRLTKAVRRQIGFVLQDDVLYESLTVWETLLYAALLRLPRTMSGAQKRDRVQEVLDALGLGKTRNSIIGGYMRRGVSGGERKRVSIGHELLINPAVLMLDEPTSGLDSTTALHLLSLLRRLANEGRAILTTIHQPSSRLYQKLDKLMLLSEGHVMYYGSAHLVTDWFAHYGFQLQLGINTADFIMDVAMGEVRSGKLHGKLGINALQRTFEEWYQTHSEGYHRGVGKEQMPKLVLEGTDKAGRPSGQEPVRVVVEGESSEESDIGVVGVSQAGQRRDGATYTDQVGVLLSRSLKVRRFEALTGTNLLQMVAVAIITGLLWWQRGRKDNMAAANDIMGLLFFEMLFPSFRALFSALFTFPNEFRMLLKERPSGMYKLSAYYFARIVADLPIEIIFPLIFQVIIYWFGGLRADAGAYFSNLFSLVLIVLTAQSWGLLIGGLFMDPKTAQAVTTVVMLSFLLVSGFYVRDVPVWIGWIKYLSFLYWGYDLLLKIEFRNRTFKDCGGGLSSSGGSGPCTTVTDLKSALRLPINPDANVWPEVVVIIGMLLALRLVTYYVLRRKTQGTKI